MNFYRVDTVQQILSEPSSFTISASGMLVAQTNRMSTSIDGSSQRVLLYGLKCVEQFTLQAQVQVANFIEKQEPPLASSNFLSVFRASVNAPFL